MFEHTLYKKYYPIEPENINEFVWNNDKDYNRFVKSINKIFVEFISRQEFELEYLYDKACKKYINSDLYAECSVMEDIRHVEAELDIFYDLKYKCLHRESLKADDINKLLVMINKYRKFDIKKYGLSLIGAITFICLYYCKIKGIL